MIGTLLSLLTILCLFAAHDVRAQGMNLARYTDAKADSVSSAQIAWRAVDGIVCDSSRWVSGDGDGPHWLEVELPDEFELGSAHVFTGVKGDGALADFSLESWDGSKWVAIPGGSASGNQDTQKQLLFSESVKTTKVRLVIPADGEVSVTELALFSPNDGKGFPIDKDVELEVALTPMVTASSQLDSKSRPFLATDGIVDDASCWASEDAQGPHQLELEFNLPRSIASAHIYCGEGSGAIHNFHLNYATDDGWKPIPGASFSDNEEDAIRIDFDPIFTTGVQLVIEDNGSVRVRELALLPPNGGKGYPLGTEVKIAPPAQTRYATYWDNLYTLENKQNGLAVDATDDGAAILAPATGDPSQQYYVLNLYGTDFYRIVNRETQLCLEVAGASEKSNAPVREHKYYALDHQLWTIEDTGNEQKKLINVHSGMALAASGSQTNTQLVQQPTADSDDQQWSIVFRSHYPKKGLAEQGGGRRHTDQRISHYYNWGKDPGENLPDTMHLQPMHWGNGGWEDLALRQAEWAATSWPVYLMGFNEPDRPDQSRMPWELVVKLWSRFEAVELPLVSPSTSWWNNGWAQNFFRVAKEMGMRYDAVAIHVYIGWPNADQFLDICDSASRNYGAPVWNTEWNVVNWGGPAGWTFEQHYTWMAEVLYRMELDDHVARYEFFPFALGWPNGAPGAPWEHDRLTLRPLGRLFGSWDGDTQLRENTYYYLHNRDSHKRIASGEKKGVPGMTGIFDIHPATNWLLVAADNGKYFIVSRANGWRLSTDGKQLTLASARTQDASAQWTLTHHRHGYYFIENDSTGARLQFSGNEDAPSIGSIELADASAQWRFIKVYKPGALPGKRDKISPEPPQELSIVEGYDIVKISWKNVARPSDFAGYNIYRAKKEGGRFKRIAKLVNKENYADMSVKNGRTYYYAVSSVDFSGNESDRSETVAGTPNNWLMTDEADPAVTYTSEWGTYVGQGGFMRTEHFCESAGATATFTFEGSHIRVYGFVRNDLGFADIILDGELVDSVDCYSRRRNFHALLFEDANLKPGKHTIQVRCNGKSNPDARGFEIILDAFEYIVDGPDAAAPSIPTGLGAKTDNQLISLNWTPNPEADFIAYTLSRADGEDREFSVLAENLTDSSYEDRTVKNGRKYAYRVNARDAAGNVSEYSESLIASPGVIFKVDDAHESISYTGRWGQYGGNPGYKNTEHYSETTGSEATFTFEGCKVLYYGHRREDLGIAEILLDGKSAGKVDCFWQTTSYGQLLFTSDDLPMGKHTLTVRLTGEKHENSSGTEIIVDAFEYKTIGEEAEAAK
ncbi:RICIN domain-containing protein [Candidatus Sumerlaeota bacterium]|nr:RICIN domain-containing protein [Candidatus Sumerlaeota bacterium]